MSNRYKSQKILKLYTHMSGLTLLEILIAVVVLSIGLLGLAGLQATSLRGNHDAYLRSQAVYAAQDIADRMRSNLDAVFAGGYVVNAVPNTPTFDCITNFDQTTADEQCSSIEMAAADVSLWVTGQPTVGVGNTGGIQAALPAGRGNIACTDANAADALACSPGSVHTVTVRWDGSRSNAQGTNCPPQSNADLQCVRLSFQP